MTVVGKVENLWRYPVKSMRGEKLGRAFLGFGGLYGDRMYAFTSSAAPKGFPFFTGREQSEMLRYRPRFLHPDKAVEPPNLVEAEGVGSGATPLFAEAADLAIEVETPSGEALAVDDPALIDRLTATLGNEHALSLARSDRALTDCRPISMFSIQTAKKLGEEIEVEVDPRRFRANLYVDLTSGRGFDEDRFVGRSLRIGPKAVVAVVNRDSRCKMITLDPDTGESSPELLRAVAKAHEGQAGVYGAVLAEGVVHEGDEIELLR